MTLKEAIRINTVLKGAPILKDDPRIIEALNLDIEALKRVKWHKDQHQQGYYELLPGETKE